MPGQIRKIMKSLPSSTQNTLTQDGGLFALVKNQVSSLNSITELLFLIYQLERINDIFIVDENYKTQTLSILAMYVYQMVSSQKVGLVENGKTQVYVESFTANRNTNPMEKLISMMSICPEYHEITGLYRQHYETERKQLLLN